MKAQQAKEAILIVEFMEGDEMTIKYMAKGQRRAQLKAGEILSDLIGVNRFKNIYDGKMCGGYGENWETLTEDREEFFFAG